MFSCSGVHIDEAHSLCIISHARLRTKQTVLGTAGRANHGDIDPAAKELSPEVNHGPGLGGAQKVVSEPLITSLANMAAVALVGTTPHTAGACVETGFQQKAGGVLE